MIWVIDHKGQRNLLAQEIPSAVGMVGFFIPELGGDYDFARHRFDGMVARGEARQASLVKRG